MCLVSLFLFFSTGFSFVCSFNNSHLWVFFFFVSSGAPKREVETLTEDVGTELRFSFGNLGLYRKGENKFDQNQRKGTLGTQN